MLLTEEEARGNREKKIQPKQCRNIPLIPVEVQGSALQPQQRGMQFQGVPCIGTGCMNWRWWNDEQTHGFCGASGVPEVPVNQVGEIVRSTGMPAVRGH